MQWHNRVVVYEFGYPENPSREPMNRLVADAIQESLSGLLSRRRAEARAQGLVGQRVLLRIPIERLFHLVKARLDGLRGEDEVGETPDAPLAHDDDNEVQALTIDPPSLEALRDRWLPELGVRIDNDVAVLDVEVPQPRRAHAR